MGRKLERVHFRLIKMPCCNHMLCWVNPRLPNFCPECGKLVIANVSSGVLKSDYDAVLEVHE